MRDLYTVLGVARDADTAEIRKAYKKLARKYHPDISDSDEDAERFKEINAAHAVLGDKEKRKLYDEFGEISLRPGFDADQARAWKQAGGGGGMPGGGFHWGGSGGGPDFSGGFGGFAAGGMDPDDILSAIFGGRPRRGPRKGQDIQAEVQVSLLDVARGEAIELQLRRPVVARGGPQTTLVMQEEKLKVRLPPGVEDGATIRLRGKGGESPQGGPPGDLRLTIHVREEPGLHRVGDSLELEVPITFAEALVGGRITVPTFDGDVKVTVPGPVQSGQKLRLKGKGMKLESGRGDLLLVLRPTPPAEVGEEEAGELAERLGALYTRDVREELEL